MARTKDISLLVTKHRDALARLIARANELPVGESRERSWLAEAIAFQSAVEWEVLSASWLKASMNRNNPALREFVERKVSEALRKQFPVFADSPHLNVVVAPMKHFNMPMIEMLMDPDGKNKGFWQYEHLVDRKKLIPASFWRHVASLGDDDWRVLSVSQAGRNVIAHRSVSAARELNIALRDCSKSRSSKLRKLVPGSRPINAENLGAFLQATPSGSKVTRLRIVLDGLDRVMRAMDPKT